MNKRNSNKWIVILLTMILLVAAAPVFPVQAASATLTMSATSSEIHVGDIVEVTLTIAADATIGDFEGYLRYDDSIFEFYSAASCITGGAGVLRISDIGASPSAQERNYKIYFKAVDKGDCKVEIYDRPIVYAYSDGSEMSVSGFGKTFTVYPAVSASDNSNLETLHLVDSRIQTVELTPTFDSRTKIYYASVPYESDGIVVSAKASDTSASVKVSGDGELVFGENTVCIEVTAEDGSVSEYLVYVYRAEKPVLPTETPKEEGNTGDTSETEKITVEPGVVLKQDGEEIFVTEYHTYRFCDIPSTFIIPDGYVETNLMMDEVTVTAYAKQDASGQAFLLLVLANESGRINWYRYDRAEQTIQRVSEEEFVITQVVIDNNSEWKAAAEQYLAYQKVLIATIAILCGACLFLLVVIIWLSVSNRRYKNER